MFYNIRVDSILLAYLATRKVKVEELFVIACFNLNKIGLLKAYLVGMNGDQMTAYFQSLERKQLLRKLTPELVGFDWDNYELTDIADDLYETCSANIYESEGEPVVGSVQPESPQTKRDKMSKNEEFAKFMTEFIALWPEGVRNNAGEYLRSNQKDLITKMLSFVIKYKYDFETIKTATRTYLKRQATNGYAFCNQAHFFVSKNGDSKLATECEAVASGNQSAEDTGAWINRM